jgi:hypothetical protein
MAAAGGPEAVWRCPLLDLLLLLLVAGPTLCWNDPGECCRVFRPLASPFQPPYAGARRLRGDRFPLRLICSLPGSFALPSGDGWEWAGWFSCPFLSPPSPGLQPRSLSEPGWLHTHLRLVLLTWLADATVACCCHGRLLLWFVVVMPPAVSGSQLVERAASLGGWWLES